MLKRVFRDVVDVITGIIKTFVFESEECREIHGAWEIGDIG